MCHDALKFLARVFKQTGNKSKMEHGGVLHDERCAGDVVVENWVSTYDRWEETNLLLMLQ